LLEVWVRENLSIRNISHEELDNDLELQDLSAECFSSDLGTLAESLDQTSLSLRVF
jgi:hypothetical protein